MMPWLGRSSISSLFYFSALFWFISVDVGYVCADESKISTSGLQDAPGVCPCGSKLTTITQTMHGGKKCLAPVAAPYKLWEGQTGVSELHIVTRAIPGKALHSTGLILQYEY